MKDPNFNSNISENFEEYKDKLFGSHKNKMLEKCKSSMRNVIKGRAGDVQTPSNRKVISLNGSSRRGGSFGNQGLTAFKSSLSSKKNSPNNIKKSLSDMKFGQD